MNILLNNELEYRSDKEVLLPLPHRLTNMVVEDAIRLRRSIRSYLKEPLTLEELSMILWAAQGITDVIEHKRAAPSAGATYPLVLYVVVGKNGVEDLEAGVYKYHVLRHSLVLHKPGDFRYELSLAALGQECVREAPVDIVFVAVFERTTKRYGERGMRYVFIDVGHAAENIYLMATALGLGTVAVGAFMDEDVSEVLDLELWERPVYIMPVGRPSPEELSGNSFDTINRFILNHRGV